MPSGIISGDVVDAQKHVVATGLIQVKIFKTVFDDVHLVLSFCFSVHHYALGIKRIGFKTFLCLLNVGSVISCISSVSVCM